MPIPTTPRGKQRTRFIASLGDFVETQYEEAKTFRETSGVNTKLLKSQGQYNGIYDQEILNAIREMGGTDVYRRLTAMKCNTLVSWINDILLDPNDRFWDLSPTPIPDLPERIKLNIIAQTEQATMEAFNTSQGQMTEADIRSFAERSAKEMRDTLRLEMQRVADEKTSNMQREITDQLIDGKFNDALFDFFSNYSIFQSAFVKGPLVRIEKMLKWVNGRLETQDRPVLSWYAPSPLDMYHSPDANNVNEGRIFETVRYTREELYMLQNIPNYNGAAIKRLLAETTTPPQNDDDYIQNDREEFENRDTYSEMMGLTKFEGVEMWGPVPGYLLEQFGIKVEDVLNSYEAHVIKIDREVILATLNEDPLKRRPYYMSSYQYVPGSFWGISLPESMEDIQRECNAAIRALCDNLAISSGPMAAYDLAQLPPDEKITKLYPWKIFTFDGTRSFNTRKAVEFFQPASNASELLGVYNSIRQEADNVTSIPGFATGGTQVSGAGETASGLSILQSNMTKGIKNHILGISKDVIKPALERMYNWNMLYNPKPEIKGDSQVLVRGPLKVTTKEQKQLRLNEFIQTTNNELDMSIIGMERRANLLREQAKTLDLPSEDIVPSKEEMQRLKAQQEAQQQQQQQQQLPVGEELDNESL